RGCYKAEGQSQGSHSREDWGDLRQRQRSINHYSREVRPYPGRDWSSYAGCGGARLTEQQWSSLPAGDLSAQTGYARYRTLLRRYCPGQQDNVRISKREQTILCQRNSRFQNYPTAISRSTQVAVHQNCRTL